MKQFAISVLAIVIVVVLVASLSLSPVGLDGLGKQNQYSPSCKNSAFAVAIAQGDLDTVRRKMGAINLNEPYIGELVRPSAETQTYPPIRFYGCADQVTYLGIALGVGNVEMARLLLESGANPNLQFNNKAPIKSGQAICSAVKSLNVDIVELLLNHGADPNVTSLPALFCLPNRGTRDSSYFQVFNTLLKHGADIGYYSPNGDSLFSMALYRGDTEMMHLLIDNGFPLGPAPRGGSPLRYAARAKLVEAVRLLLEAGADANDGGIECKSNATITPCKGYTTALHEAVDLQDYQYPQLKQQSVEITAMLLKHGAKPNVLSDGVKTPLFLASYSSNHEAVSLLLKAGADPRYDAPPNLRRRFNRS